MANQREALSIDEMVNRFLGWPLPASLQANMPSIDRPIGTHMMNADEARAMFAYCLSVQPTSGADAECEA